MKTLLVFLLSIIIFKNSYSQSDWKWITPNPPNKMVLSSSVVDNKAYLWCSYYSVVKLDFETDNFNVLPTYTSAEPCGGGDFSYQGIAFADSVNGYVTDVCNGQFRTTDGGQTWTKTAESGSNIHLVCFGTPMVGWKLGGGGVYKTTNAGATWNPSSIPIGAWNNGGLFTRMYAINQNQIWLLQKASYSGAGSGVWYSSNGGNSWTGLNTGLISDGSNQVAYYDIKMNSSGLGYIVGSTYKSTNNTYEGFILRTTDLGINWTVSQFPGEKYDAILLLNNNDVVAFGNVGDTYQYNNVVQRRTSDSGASWVFSNPISNSSNYTYFYDAVYSTTYDAIYIFAGYSCYKSTDNGLSYQRVANQLDVSVSDVTFDSKPINSDSQLGVAWLKWNTKPYLITYDGGQTWHKKSLPQSMGYIWLVGIAEEVIYMITDQDKLYKSTDLGETWNKLNVPVYYSGLQALSVYNKDVVVLNAYKNLVSTTDGGSSWILGPTLGNVWLQETDISEPGFIAAVGTYYDSLAEKGCFFNSSDFGLSWHLFDTDDEMKDVMMLGSGIGYALGNKNLYKTTNSGVSWEKILSRGGNWSQGYICFAFSDTSNGVLYSDEGMNITQTGGKTWSKRDYKIPFYSANKAAFNSRGDLFIISESSLVMLTSEQSFVPEINITPNETISEYYLSSSFPNPFNSSSTIKYYIPSTSQVIIKVFNTLGEEIETLVDEVKSTGTYQVTWNAKDLTSGVYFYRMQTGSFVQTRKMILLK